MHTREMPMFNSTTAHLKYGLLDSHVLMHVACRVKMCKSVLCFELACAELHISFRRQKATSVSISSRSKVDMRGLSIKFSCVRLINNVQRVLSLYKHRFVAALPESRRTSADFSRPAFIAAAFFLCSKKNKLKVDKVRLMEMYGTSDPEFGNIVNSMNDLCFDLVGVAKEKRDPKTMKSNQDAVRKYCKQATLRFEKLEAAQALSMPTS